MLPFNVLASIDLYRQPGLVSSDDGPLRLFEVVVVDLLSTGMLRPRVVWRGRYLEQEGKPLRSSGQPLDPPRPTTLSDDEHGAALGALYHSHPVGIGRPRWTAR